MFKVIVSFTIDDKSTEGDSLVTISRHYRGYQWFHAKDIETIWQASDPTTGDQQITGFRTYANRTYHTFCSLDEFMEKYSKALRENMIRVWN